MADNMKIIPNAENFKKHAIADQIDNLRESLGFIPLENILEQLLDVFSNQPINAEQLPFLQSKVALLFECLMENWQKNGKVISDLKNKISDFFASKNTLPEFFRQTRPKQLKKRQPDILESVLETLKRFEIMERLETVFEKPCHGMIIGGSLSYGPFYNIRSRKDDSGSSDIDAIFVLAPNSNDKDWEGFLNCPYFSESDKQKFIARKNIFLKSLLPKGEAVILSQKFHLKGTDYEISLHLFTDESFNSLLDANITKEVESDDKVVTMKDYKSEPFPHAVCPQTNFDGATYNYVVPEQRNTDKGVITELPAYIIDKHRFHPGVYQNIILPNFSIFHDRDGKITDKLSKFKKGVEDYIRNSSGKNPEITILKTHPRTLLFPETLEEDIT
jgi:hypothetical protein